MQTSLRDRADAGAGLGGLDQKNFDQRDLEKRNLDLGDLFAMGTLSAEAARGFADGAPAAYAARQPAIERFCAWRGRSGRRYVASIYGFDDCPDYEHVVALAVRRDADGRRAVLAAIDLGAFPIMAMGGEAMTAARAAGANEAHLHLLAETGAARAAAIADLV